MWSVDIWSVHIVEIVLTCLQLFNVYCGNMQCAHCGHTHKQLYICRVCCGNIQCVHCAHTKHMVCKQLMCMVKIFSVHTVEIFNKYVQVCSVGCVAIQWAYCGHIQQIFTNKDCVLLACLVRMLWKCSANICK